MKITQMDVDGFGVWSGLRLGDLSGRITVFYGPNEAGKTTLLQFIRSVFYGVSPERRRSYLGVWGDDAAAGGSLEVDGPDGPMNIHRRALGGAAGEGAVTVTAADGTMYSENALQSSLQGVDESIYNNVFAIGLRELQELATLSDTEAAAWLYNLTVGLDRVSVSEVIGDLDESLGRLLSSGDRRSQITDLLAQRDALQSEIRQLAELTRRWEGLGARQRQVNEAVAENEQAAAELDRRARAVEMAIAVREKWLERSDIDRRLRLVANPLDIDEASLAELDRLNKLLERRRSQWTSLRQRRREARQEAAALNVNQRLWRRAPRIEALGEQQQWIGSLQAEVDHADAQVRDLESRHDVACRRAGIPPDGASTPTQEIPRHLLSTLRAPARAWRDARRVRENQRDQVEQAERAANAAAGQIRAALSARGENDLPTALDAAGERVAQLRQRVQFDERIDQATRNREELELRSCDSLQDQILPLWMLASIGGVFALGVLLLLVGLFVTPQAIGNLGIALASLGVVGFGAAAIVKLVLDRSSSRQLDNCHKQIALVDRQLEQWKSERDDLDRRLPLGGGPLTARLQSAERDLAAMEDLLPLDAQRQTAEQEYLTAQQRLEDAERDVDSARQGWTRALIAAGLPSEMKPSQVRAVAGVNREVFDLRASLARAREDARRRRQELESVAQRIRLLAEDAGASDHGFSTTELLQNMLDALSRQRNQVERLDALRQRSRALRRKQARCRQSGVRLRARIRRLLSDAGVDREEDFHTLYQQAAEVRQLSKRHTALDEEIRAALGGSIDPSQLSDLLAPGEADQLEAKWESITTEVDALDAQRNQWFQQRGEIEAERRQLAEDRRLPEKMLELGAVETRLQAAIENWQVQAVTRLLLETIRREYEKNRQPQTLVEASGYLSQLTGERYARVWTPLGEDVLFVEDENGESLSVDALSRGTREQLFLSLRLALVAMYARRGVHLPLVLDDVLVNFDVDRAKAAAHVLRDFAKQGRQLLVFTCHEHIWKMFKSMRVDARRLPDRTTPRRLASVARREAVRSGNGVAAKRTHAHGEVELLNQTAAENEAELIEAANLELIEIAPAVKEEIERVARLDEARKDEATRFEDGDESEYDATDNEEEVEEEEEYGDIEGELDDEELEDDELDEEEKVDEEEDELEDDEQNEYEDEDEEEYEEDEYEEDDLEDDEEAEYDEDDEDEEAELEDEEYDDGEDEEEDDAEDDELDQYEEEEDELDQYEEEDDRRRPDHGTEAA